MITLEIFLCEGVRLDTGYFLFFGVLEMGFVMVGVLGQEKRFFGQRHNFYWGCNTLLNRGFLFSILFFYTKLTSIIQPTGIHLIPI